MQFVDLLNFIVIAISTILTIVMICWFYIFYRLIHIPQISSRNPRTSLLAGFFAIIGVSLSHNFQLIFMNMSSIKYIPYTNLLTYIFVMVATGACYHVLTLRAFIVYYNICWNKAMEDKKWRLFIDPHETNWFLKNRNTWGSPKRIAMIASAHWSFWVIIGTFAIIYNGPNEPESPIARGSIASASILVVSCDIILYLKFPKFEDCIGLLDETKIIIKYKVISVAVYLILAVVLDAPSYSIQYLCLAALGILVAFGFVAIIYFWVFKKFQFPTVPWKIEQFVMEFSADKLLSIQSEMDKCNSNLNELTLKNVLQDEDGFECFSRHLSKQYCLENILFFVETQQWLISLLMKNEYEKFVDGDILSTIKEGNSISHTLLTIVFPKTAPKSRIVIENIDEEKENGLTIQTEYNYPTTNEYVQCIKIFKKFIPNSAYFSINIDSRSRYQLFQKLGFNEYDSSQDEEDIVKILKEKTKITKKQLFQIFDECRIQVYQLLTFAFVRFKVTKQYQKLKQKLSTD